MITEFKFIPRQHVKIVAYNLDAIGRVLRCVFDGGGIKYEVEYALNSEIKCREFYEDELSEQLTTG